jgi:hypothetical protein
MSNPTEQILKQAQKFEGDLSQKNLQKDHEGEIEEIQNCIEDDEEEEGVAKNVGEQDDRVIKYIKTPNFTDCGSANSQLPIGFANEAITFLSKLRSEFDFVDFIKEKLKYNSRVAVCMSFMSEQIDALVLAIKQFESGKALILGDMAGMGKGRVVAGVLRYAYVNKLIPIFITEKENLFSEMYKDMLDIGGFGMRGGNIINPKPLILRPRDNKKIYDEDGNYIRTVFVNALRDDENNEYDTTQPLPAWENKKQGLKSLNRIILENDDFPITNYGSEFEFNCIFLNYDVIGKSKSEVGNKKRYLLRDIAPKSIFVFDECHNATGKSKIGEWSRTYVAEAKGVMFSSATFAKNPESFPLYIIKTSMSEAQIDVTSLEAAIGVGGENVSEYISSVLVKEGQMIRRDRDFSGCTVGTIYDGYNIRNPIEKERRKDEIYRIFNSCVKQFADVYNYSKQPAFKEAINFAISRLSQQLADDEGMEMADSIVVNGVVRSYNDLKVGNADEDDELRSERASYIRQNRNKWVLERFEINTLKPNTKFHFSENLLNAIKTKFVAESIVEELKRQVEYTNVDGTKQITNRKPVIALRGTAENAIDRIINSGIAEDLMENDFSLYLRAIVSGVKVGKATYRKVNNDLFAKKSDLREVDREHIEEVRMYEILDEDLPDNGQVLNNLLEQVNSFNSEMPLSPIDYIIDTIESTQRELWDLRYNFTSRTKYKVNEVTGRNYALKKQDDGMWLYTSNDRVRSVKTAFNMFNSGTADVLIINSSGSTGGSIQSSEKFKDKRQRVMFITQVELDINTEVQKRGRINRTGQVNYPAYIYVLSQVPSEIRKFLSLARKLRKLDANVSANQTQNSNILQLCDKNGRKIEDFFNTYGEEAFKIFLDNDDNDEYRDIYARMLSRSQTSLTEEYTQEGENTKALLQPYTRELEIETCDIQEFFYDSMNTIYKDVVKQHKNNNTFQLELEVEDLKASLRTRFVKSLNNGNSEFAKPLFIEDKYCLPRRRNWTKEKLSTEIVRLAKKFYDNREDDYTTITAYHRHLLDDFEVNYESYATTTLENFRLSKEPIRDDYSAEEDYNNAVLEYEEALSRTIQRLDNDRITISEILRYFYPDRPVHIPDTYLLRGANTNTAEATTTYREGKFVGYVFKNTSVSNKYSKGSIHLRFAFIQKSPVTAELSLGRYEHLQCLRQAMQSTYFSQTQMGTDGKTFGERNIEKVNKWQINPNVREIVRFLSGNLLSGISEANSMDDITRWSLVKYTNDDGTVSTGIKLFYADDAFRPLVLTDAQGNPLLDRITSKISVAMNNVDIIEYLKNTPIDFTFNLAVNTYASRNVSAVPNAKDFNVVGLIKIHKWQSMNKLLVYIFQGTPTSVGRYKDEARDNVLSNIPFKNYSNVNNPIYFAPFLNQYTTFQQKTYRKDDTISGYKLEHSSFRDGRLYPSGNAKVYLFDNIDTTAGENRLREFLLKLYNEQTLTLEFPQDINDYYNVPFQRETSVKMKSEEKKVVKAFEDGDYKYKLEVTFDENYRKSLPPEFKSYDNGYIILNQPIVPQWSNSYQMYPFGFSDKDTMKLFLSIFQPDEKAKFLRELDTKKNQPPIMIADYVSTVTKDSGVSNLKFIFGERRYPEIGQLVKTFASTQSIEGLSEIQKLEQEILAEIDLEAAQAIKPIKKTLKSNTAFQDVENFLNYLLF